MKIAMLSVALAGVSLVSSATADLDRQLLRNFDGDGGGEMTISDTEIGKVDGNGTWTLWGKGQDLVINDKKDGRGSLTLRNFASVTIRGKKDGDGTLTLEDCKSFSVTLINGRGDTYLKFDGTKTIGTKDGDGNVYFTGQPPEVTGVKNGNGQIKRLK